MRHRLLSTLAEAEATVSQLAATLGSNKGNIAHHLKILVDAGLVVLSGTRQVRGGTERYYRRVPGDAPVADESLRDQLAAALDRNRALEEENAELRRRLADALNKR